MWEHCILNELHGHLQTRSINYWRDKRENEIDFVISNRAGNNLTAIECKFNYFSDDTLSSSITKNFEAFRNHYPNGENFVVAHNIDTPFTRSHKGVTISFVNPKDLIKRLAPKN